MSIISLLLRLIICLAALFFSGIALYAGWVSEWPACAITGIIAIIL